MEKMKELEAIKADAGELFDGVLEPAGEPIELDDMERLAIARAFENAVKDITDSKRAGSLRDRVDRRMAELYRQTKARTFDVWLRGQKVGTYSLAISKPTESKEVSDFVVSDRDAFSQWPDFGAVAYSYALDHMQDVADWHFGMTGEVPDGCELQTFVVPGSPGGEIKWSSLRVKEGEVARVLAGELEGAARMMLEGGADE